MVSVKTSPLEILKSLYRNRQVVYSAVIREVKAKYQGTYMGWVWTILNPIIMLLVYTFVFGVIFQMKWGKQTNTQIEFALLLFAGLCVFNLFSETLSRAAESVIRNPNYVKKVVFPLEILPWVGMGVALFNLLVSLVVWMAAFVVFVSFPSWTVVLLPLVILPVLLFAMGLSWFLASVGVYARDVSQVIGLGLTAMMFLSPVFYPIAALPEEYRVLMYLNPLTSTIENVRQVLYWGELIDFYSWSLELVAGAIVAWLGFVWFQKTRKGFADVL